MKSSRVLAVRLPEETWEFLRREAAWKGITPSKLVRAKIMLSTDFEDTIMSCMDEFSKRTGISRHAFIEAVITDFLARIEACERVHGENCSLNLPQFVQTDKGTLRGGDLYDHLVSHYIGVEKSSGRSAGRGRFISQHK